jgi:hypothetical protein
MNQYYYLVMRIVLEGLGPTWMKSEATSGVLYVVFACAFRYWLLRLPTGKHSCCFTVVSIPHSYLEDPKKEVFEGGLVEASKSFCRISNTSSIVGRSSMLSDQPRRNNLLT